MEHNHNYYDDRKYCDSCSAYVHYLMSIDHSFCVECGGTVRLFSKDDWLAFNEEIKQRRPQGGRPRKSGRGKESA